MLRPSSRPPAAAGAGASMPRPAAASTSARAPRAPRGRPARNGSARRIRGSRRIVVISRKGGAGKTTTTLMLGHTFATPPRRPGRRPRREPRRRQPGHADAPRDAVLGHRPARRAHLGRAVLPRSARSPRRTRSAGSRWSRPTTTRGSRRPSGEQDYRARSSTSLDRHYNLVLVDTGTGILDDAIQGILEEADQLVVVMPPALDGGAGRGDDPRLAGAARTRTNSSRRGRRGQRGPRTRGRSSSTASRSTSRPLRLRPPDPVGPLEAGAHSALADLRPETRPPTWSSPPPSPPRSRGLCPRAHGPRAGGTS